MSDADTGELSPVPDDPAPRLRDCFECAQPIPAERWRSSFCSDRCRQRNKKRRQREYVVIELEVAEARTALRIERGPIGSVWGVLCDREVAEILREAARPPPRQRRRIPFPKGDMTGATIDA